MRYRHTKTFKLFPLLMVSLGLISAFKARATETLAPVSGFARSFISDANITDATITILETGQQIKTDNRGQFGPILYPVGKPITLILEKWGYTTTQSASIIVPQGGLTGRYNNISFQVPSVEAYFLLTAIIRPKIDKNSCHLATTMTAFQKTMDDIPQGEAGTTITIEPNVNHEPPFYFDIFSDGPLKGKTNPFTKGLTQTSEDGGVLIFNLPPRDEPYTLSARKAGVEFSRVQFICRKDAFINLSPPQGPMANS